MRKRTNSFVLISCRIHDDDGRLLGVVGMIMSIDEMGKDVLDTAGSQGAVGMLINCVEDGQEAVRMFREFPEKYDLIFMDVQMPIMDGYEATRHIRTLNVPRAKTIPIIAMTANVFWEDIEECLKAGMNSHLGKPLNFDEVLERLRVYLHKRESSR